MASIKFTQTEADRLLKMVKYTLAAQVDFPSKGKNQEFKVEGDSKQDVFIVNIFRSNIKPSKYNLGARIKKNNVVLLELHINPSNVHPNPDGEKIIGSHWHVYKEGYDLLWAFPAENIDSEQFVENTIMFLDKFNVLEKPDISFQMELV